MAKIEGCTDSLPYPNWKCERCGRINEISYPAKCAQCGKYRRKEAGCYTMGFYDPKGEWQPESDHDSKESAAERVHYLNGGK